MLRDVMGVLCERRAPLFVLRLYLFRRPLYKASSRVIHIDLSEQEDTMFRHDHIHHHAADPAGAIDWYKRVFGAAEIERHDIRGGEAVRLDIGGGEHHRPAETTRRRMSARTEIPLPWDRSFLFPRGRYRGDGESVA